MSYTATGRPAKPDRTPELTIPAGGENGQVLTKTDNGYEWKTPTTYGAASTTKAGLVKMANNVSYAAGEAPTAAEFKALIDALIAAHIMKEPSVSDT